MSAKSEVQDSLYSIMLFLRLFKTFELGELVHICQLLDTQSSLYQEKVLSRMLVHFIFCINEENKKNHGQCQYFGIMIVESLIYNLFRQNNKNQINNSIYSNSIMISSASQIGIQDQSTYSNKHYENSENNVTSLATFLQDFVTDEELAKKLKQMIERGGRNTTDGANQNQRYIEILLETIEYILNKEGKAERNEKLQSIRDMISSRNTAISSHFQKKNLKIIIKDVNKIIFSNKLNRIVFLLQEASESVYFSLLRIYLGQLHHDESDKKKSIKYYSDISYTGEQMLLNINWVYIESIANKNELFETPKNPLFKLIQSYLLNSFIPVFRSFHKIVGKCCKHDYANGLQFYSKCESTITKQLGEFIDLLPQNLLDYLRQVYLITLKSLLKSSKKESSQNMPSLALVRVKKLLVYSLLVQPSLIQAYYSQGVDLQKYEQVCNFIINLFFKSSLKKYSQMPEADVQCVTNLTKLISNRIDEIMSEANEGDFDEYERSIDVRNYILEAPVLNHDYETLWEVIKNIEFTPKDQKQFVMHQKEEISNNMVTQGANMLQYASLTNTNHYGQNLTSPRESVFSPMQRGKKELLDLNESINCENMSEDAALHQSESIEFLTWMAVGGSRDYEAKPFRNRGASTQKLKELSQMKMFPKAKIRQISSLYSQYQRIMS